MPRRKLTRSLTHKFIAAAHRSLLPCCLYALLAGIAVSAFAQTATPADIQQWMAAGQWQLIVDRLGPMPHRSAEMDFDYGTALGHLRRWPDAAAAFRAGERLAPRDPRFPTELAGVAFEQKHYPQAARHLRRALRLTPSDPYIRNFLGTVYFLENNLPAAIQCWNRVGKPYLASVREEPQPRVSPSLLDGAFAFSPASTLTFRQYLDSRQRVSALGIFPQYQFDLRARPDGNFDMVFRGDERNGFGSSRLEALFLLLRGLPFQEVNPEYDNASHQAINFTSTVRWDAQKRRIQAELSGPLRNSAQMRYGLLLGLINENWALRQSFTGPAPVLASLNLRREGLAVDIANVARDRAQWSVGAELSHRDYRNVSASQVLTQPMLAAGFQLKQRTRVTANLWRVPAHRFTLHGQASSQLARLWSPHPQTFAKLQGGLGWRWFPRAQGEDYETVNRLRAGETIGQVPFDELFVLGLGPDNHLPMHAHIGTRDGRKGSAPLGRDYLLENWESNKNLYSNGIFTMQAGPLIDIGAIRDPGTALGSHQWLYDAGAQLKLKAFGEGIAFSWGHDLRTGNNAIYATVLHAAW